MGPDPFAPAQVGNPVRGTTTREQTSTVARGGDAGAEEVSGMEEGASAGAVLLAAHGLALSLAWPKA